MQRHVHVVLISRNIILELLTWNYFSETPFRNPASRFLQQHRMDKLTTRWQQQEEQGTRKTRSSSAETKSKVSRGSSVYRQRLAALAPPLFPLSAEGDVSAPLILNDDPFPEFLISLSESCVPDKSAFIKFNFSE